MKLYLVGSSLESTFHIVQAVWIVHYNKHY